MFEVLSVFGVIFFIILALARVDADGTRRERPGRESASRPSSPEIRRRSPSPPCTAAAPAPQRSVVRPAQPARPSEAERCPKLYGTVLRGRAHVIDGDTIIVAKQRIRLAGIDAPELDHPYGQKAKWEMVKICKGQEISVRLNGFRSHERVVGFCYLPDGTDIGAELIRRGLALDYGLFSNGHYRGLEPEGARKRILGSRWAHEQAGYAARTSA